MLEISAKIEKGVCKKNGREYIMVKIPLAPNYVKVVFLDPAEQALVNVTYNKNYERSFLNGYQYNSCRCCNCSRCFCSC